MVDEHAELVEHIMRQNMLIARTFAEGDMQRGRDSRWLSLDLTMPQLKTVMIVMSLQGATIGQLAKRLGVGLPTASGIVDRLHEHGFVNRQEDPEDRRITRVTPTEKSREIVEKLQSTDNVFWKHLLSDLSVEDLRTVTSALAILLKALHKNLPSNDNTGIDEEC
jgi:DNA-binding MarR family transcriptional regulator